MTVSTPYLGFDKDVHVVGGLWERFHAGLLEPGELRDPYHQLLLTEWRRCSSLGVDVTMTMARRLSDDEVHERSQASRLLLDTSVSLIEDVGRFLDTIPGLMLLTDTTGCVLHVAGSQATQDHAAGRSGIVRGSRWEESAAGTNGMGTALATRQPVHVFATEHFCEGWHRWSCSAAPIFDTDGSTVVGIIDFTTSHTDFRDQALALTVSLANSIGAKMTLRREIDRSQLVAVFAEATRNYPNDDMLVLDHAGRPILHSATESGSATARRWQSGQKRDEQILRTVEVHSARTGDSIGRVVHLPRPLPPPAPRLAHSPDRQPRAPLSGSLHFGQFVSCDPTTMRTLGELEKVAQADVNVLLTGETGTGKELIARQLHAGSPRRAEPYLAINCGAISAKLLESTFFGYVRGAFSGADPRGRAGYFESAQGGTLFLDEVGELPLPMQAALLRVLEDGSFLRVGSTQPRHARCRVLAATHRDLDQLLAAGTFRADLYYRLKIVQKHIAPLRQRVADITLLAGQFLRSLCEKHQVGAIRFSNDALQALQQYGWPGNARELRNAIEAALLCAEGEITVTCLPPEITARPLPADVAAGPLTAAQISTQVATQIPTPSPTQHADRAGSAADYERQLIVGTLRRYRKVNHTARALGLARSTLYRKFAELGIDQREFTNDLPD